MATLDIILLLCFIPALVQGIRKGFIDQAIALLSVIIGVWMSFRFSTLVSEWLKPYITASSSLLQIIAFVLILIAVILVLNIIGKAIESIAKAIQLGWLDKLLGIAFSLLKSGLIIGTLIIVFDTINQTFHLIQDKTLSESVLYGPIRDITYRVFPFFKSLLSGL